MNRSDYDRLLANLEASYKADRDAVERVWAMAQKLNGRQIATKTETPSSPHQAADNDESAGKGEVIKAITDALQELPSRFTWNDVLAYLNEQQPSVEFKATSVRQAVMRLVQLGKVEIDVQGAGRKPSVFRRAQR